MRFALIQPQAKLERILIHPHIRIIVPKQPFPSLALVSLSLKGGLPALAHLGYPHSDLRTIFPQRLTTVLAWNAPRCHNVVVAWCAWNLLSPLRIFLFASGSVKLLVKSPHAHKAPQSVTLTCCWHTVSDTVTWNTTPQLYSEQPQPYALFHGMVVWFRHHQSDNIHEKIPDYLLLLLLSTGTLLPDPSYSLAHPSIHPLTHSICPFFIAWVDVTQRYPNYCQSRDFLSSSSFRLS